MGFKKGNKHNKGNKYASKEWREAKLAEKNSMEQAMQQALQQFQQAMEQGSSNPTDSQGTQDDYVVKSIIKEQRTKTFEEAWKKVAK